MKMRWNFVVAAFLILLSLSDSQADNLKKEKANLFFSILQNIGRGFTHKTNFCPIPEMENLEVHDQLLAELRQDPINAYNKLLEWKNSNSFPIMAMPIKNILQDMDKYFSKNKNDQNLRNLRKEALAVISAQYPYERSIRFIKDYLVYLDKHYFGREIFFTHQKTGRAFEISAALNKSRISDLENLLKHPDVILFPTTKELKLNDFFKIRAVPVFFLGISFAKKTPGDGVDFSPSGFFFHDLGHTQVMSGENERSFANSLMPRSTIYMKWLENFSELALRMKTVLMTPIERRLMRILLFHFIHEIGFNYDFLEQRELIKLHIDGRLSLIASDIKENERYYGLNDSRLLPFIEESLKSHSFQEKILNLFMIKEGKE